MATYVPPKKNTAHILYTALVSQADTKLLKATPTIAAGDFKVSIDGGAFNNLATLPTVTPAAGVTVKISLSADEMNGDNITVACIDAAGAEWCDQLIALQTSARQVDDLAHPATSGRSMVVDAAGLVDANAVKLGPTGAGTAQTARDVGANVDLRSSLVADLVESQRGYHTWQTGQAFYVSPNTGNDTTGDGSRLLPYATVTKALSMITLAHSVIFLLADNASGVTTLTEAVTVNKRYVFIRGPGRDFIWRRTTNGATITVAEEGCELSGFQLEAQGASATSYGISVANYDFLRVHRVWINATQGTGIKATNSDNLQVHDCHFQGTGVAANGHGLEIDSTGGSANFPHIFDNHFEGVLGDGIRIGGSGNVNDGWIARNEIVGSSGWGVNIQAATRTTVCDNCMGENASGDINDLGTDTVKQNNKQLAKASDYTAARAAKIDNLDAAVSTRASQASLDTVDDLVDTEITDIRNRLPAALVGGRMDASVGAMAANVVTAAAVATDTVAEIAAGMTGTGIRTVTLHCQTSGAVAIGTVSIAVYDSNNTQLICTGTADANGDLVVSLDDGAYKVRATKAGYTFALASITVTANATINITGSAVTISAPSAPGLCVVYGYARDAAGVVHGNATVTAYVLTRATGRFAGGYFLTDRKKTATTDATTGKFELELQQGAVVNLECKPAGIALTEKTVPAASSQDITTW